MTGPASSDTDGTAKPVLRLVRGSATPEELAAVVAILVARSGGEPPAPPPGPPSLWATPQLRGPVFPGPGAWKASAFRL